jgi:hypothetical protein
MWCQNSGWLHAWEFEVGWDFAICLRSTGINLRRAKSVYNRMHIYSHTLEIPTKRERIKKVMNGLILFALLNFSTRSPDLYYIYLGALIYFTCIRISISCSFIVLLSTWCARGRHKEIHIIMTRKRMKIIKGGDRNRFGKGAAPTRDWIIIAARRAGMIGLAYRKWNLHQIYHSPRLHRGKWRNLCAPVDV